MTVFLAEDGASSVGGYVNPNVSSLLSSFSVDYWPVHHADVGSASLNAAFTAHFRAQSPVVEPAEAGLSYFDDYYNRIHILPQSLPLGNLVTAQIRTIEVWNAWTSTSQTLTSLTTVGADGITITAPAGYPITFAPLQSIDWEVSVSTLGPPIIGASLTFVFDGLTTEPLVVSGNRLTAWTVGPDWAQGLTETLEFMTDLETAYDGTESRTPVRVTPRRQWAYTAMAWTSQRRYIENALFGWNLRVWALPIWTDRQVLTGAVNSGDMTIACVTDDLEFSAGGLAILLQDVLTYEVIEIDSVSEDGLALTSAVANTWNAGTRLFPMGRAKLMSPPQLERQTSDIWTAPVQFVSLDQNPYAGTPTWSEYRGYPVLEDHMDETIDPQDEYDRVAFVLDNQTGLITTYDRSGITQPVKSFRWQLFSKAQRSDLKAKMYALFGRCNLVWVPSAVEDLKAVQSIADTSQSLNVENCGYTLFSNGALNRCDIRIETWDGQIFYRRVLSGSIVSSTEEQLLMDSALGTSFDPSDFKRICFMALSRFDTDSFDLTYDTDESLTLSTSFRGVTDNV